MLRKYVLFCLILLAFGSAHAENLPVVGDDDFPPFSFIDPDGSIQGIDIDTINEVGRRLNLSFDIQLVPWKRLLIMTQKGTVFGSFSLFKTPEREAYALFTHPVHYSTYNLFSVPSKISKFDALSDLYGRRLGIEAGFAISEDFDAAGRRGDFELIEVFRTEELFGRLQRGGIDGFVGNDLLTRYKHADDLKRLNITTLPKPVRASRGAFFVISKAYPLEDKQALQARISETLMAMEKDGTQQKIISTYVP